LLYGPEKVAGEIVEDRGLLGDYGRRLYRVRINAGREDEASFEIPEEDIENREGHADSVQIPGRRLEFTVNYTRTSNSNAWVATTKLTRVFSGVKANGAVGYTTGKWEGEHEGEENNAFVTVLIECDQPTRDSHSSRRLTWSLASAAKATELADRLFRTRHPDARIEHESVVR
jgi:hypothetical protein